MLKLESYYLSINNELLKKICFRKFYSIGVNQILKSIGISFFFSFQRLEV